MAKLGSYYSLCPLIDQNSLLGVANDYDRGYVIVTLGKNIAIKYKLSDQKQIRSWSSKDKFSSPVLYDSYTQKYAAVFNQSYIRLWDEREETLDKVSKYKFKIPIYTLLQCESTVLVVFQNCTITSLDNALNIRQSFVQNDLLCDQILSTHCMKIGSVCYVGIMIESKEAISFIWNAFTEGQKTKKDGRIFELKLQDSNEQLVGHFLHVGENGPQLFTLWSNAKLYMLDLNSEQSRAPGKLFTILSETISCRKLVTMMSLDQNYIAMYGANRNEEGASLLIYNVQFRVIQCQQHLKFFSEGTKIWRIDNQLLLSVKQNLAVIPFHLDTEQLAALVGSHRGRLSNSDPDITIVTDMVVTTWDDDNQDSKRIKRNLEENKTISKYLKPFLDDLMNQGWSESAICDEILNQNLEKQNTSILNAYLTCFKDIPEKSLAKLLKHCLAVEPITIPELLEDGTLKTKIRKSKLIDKILMRTFSDVMLLPLIRTEINVEDTITLLKYLCFCLNDSSGVGIGGSVPVFEYDKRLIAWGCVLLDAHYQHLLLSRDERIVKVLKNFSDIVDEYVSGIKEMQSVLPLLNQIKSKKVPNNKYKAMNSSKYSIEYLSLY